MGRRDTGDQRGVQSTPGAGKLEARLAGKSASVGIGDAFIISGLL